MLERVFRDLERTHPVGLLANGEEDSKGNTLNKRGLLRLMKGLGVFRI